MVGKPRGDDELRCVLADTIFAVCRTTVPYNVEFSVEGLLAITMDNAEILVVQINQKTKKDDTWWNVASVTDVSVSSNSEKPGAIQLQKPRSLAKKKRGRPSKKTSNKAEDVEAEMQEVADMAFPNLKNVVTPSGQSSEESVKDLMKKDDSQVLMHKDEVPEEGGGVNGEMTEGHPHLAVDAEPTVIVTKLQQLANKLSSELVTKPLVSSSMDYHKLNLDDVTYSLERKKMKSPCKVIATKKLKQKAIVRKRTREEGNNDGQLSGTYQCYFCGKAFLRLGDFKRHHRTHTGEKPYMCEFCSKTFRRKDTLQEHLRIHTGEKPYKCSFCQKCFTTYSVLHDHRKIHTGERPHKCNVCGKAFIASGGLSDHMRIHTGDKPYCCEVCGQRFTQSQHLSNHIKGHVRRKDDGLQKETGMQQECAVLYDKMNPQQQEQQQQPTRHLASIPSQPPPLHQQTLHSQVVSPQNFFFNPF